MIRQSKTSPTSSGSPILLLSFQAFFSGSGFAVAFLAGIFLIEIVPLLVSHPGYPQANEHRRNNQNQDSALQRLNDPRTRSGGLRIAKRAALRPHQARKKDRDRPSQQRQPKQFFSRAI